MAKFIEFSNHQQEVSREHMRQRQMLGQAQLSNELSRMSQQIQDKQYNNIKSLPAPDDYSAKGNRVIVEEVAT